MKKKRIASLLLLAPLTLLAACSSQQAIVLEANWFSNTSTKNIPDGFEETLVYDVSFQKSVSAEQGRFTINYPNGGTYTTKFTSGTTDDKQKTYIYTTTLTMEVEYILDGVSSGLRKDTVTTYVEFLDTAHELRPLSSWREVHGSAPRMAPGSPGATLKDCYAEFEYKVETSYNYDKDKATVTLTNIGKEAADDDKLSNTVKLDGKGMYFDNEQLIPVLRAADLSSSMTLRTIDPSTRSLEKIAIKDGPKSISLTQSVKRKTDEKAEEETFKAIEIGISYDKQNSGGTQKFTIAKRDSRDNNKWRNVCLKYEYPVIYSHGTMTYRLISADFYG